MLPGFDVSGWFALIAPKGVAPEIVARVNADASAALGQEDIIARLREAGVYPDPGVQSPEELRKYIQTESELYGRIVQLAGFEKE
jgi:tripartite-type tricarboxylate transporter receptor subunit TctC